MNVYEEKLKRYISEHNLEVEHLVFEKSCHTVEDAAETAGARPEDFVKNICMMDEEGRLIVAIVKGENRASSKKVARALGIGRPKVAEPDFILQKSGYPIGGVPSFGFEAIFVVDERIMEKERIYSGGGSSKALVRVRPEILLIANGGCVADIKK